jgi:hypothetical protein
VVEGSSELIDRGGLHGASFRAARACRPGAHRRVLRALSLLAVGGLSLVSASTAHANTDFTWNGAANEAIPTWSSAGNWESDSAPAPGETIEALSFPALPGSLPCTFPGPESGCGRGTKNNVSGLSAGSLSIDDGEDYSVIGEPITLGSGGLSAAPTTATSKFTASAIGLPITLGSSQTWHIAGAGGIEHVLENDLGLEGNLTGSASALTVDMSDGPALFLENETDVGPVEIDGADTSVAGVLNGTTELYGELNFADEHQVHLSNIFFVGIGAIGPLTTHAVEVAIGTGGYPAEGLEARSVELDSASSVAFAITETGTTAWKDYSQMVSGGAIALGGATIEVVVRPPEPGNACPTLTPGDTYTFVSTPAALSGAFANAPEHGSEISIRFAKACAQKSQTMRIAYHESGGNETVTGTVEAATKEAQETQESTERQRTKEAEAKAAEERIKAAQKAEEAALAKKNGETGAASAAAAARQHEEEAADKKHAEEATKHKEEEEAKERREVEAALDAEEATPNPAGVSLAGSTVAVQGTGEATAKLTCTGHDTCSGKLTLTVRGVAKASRKPKVIGTARFSVRAGQTAAVELALNATGKTLLAAGHGRLRVRIAILDSSLAPPRTHSDAVELVLQKTHGKTKR